MIKNTWHKFAGYTLIELLVVIAIIAILAGTVLTVVDPQGKRARARDSIRRSDISVISSALEQYYADNASYPDATSTADLFAILNPPSPGKVYLKTAPEDPQATQGAAYCYNGDGGNYNICAKLEISDVDELHGATSCSPDGNGSNPTAGVFCVTNPF